MQKAKIVNEKYQSHLHGWSDYSGGVGGVMRGGGGGTQPSSGQGCDTWAVKL